MSDAHVRFLNKAGSDAALGQEVTFAFRCPHRGHQCGRLLILGRSLEIQHDGQNEHGGRAMWTWNGNRERPTFTPSISCTNCWHGYIEDGRCVSVAKVDEPEPLS